MKPQRKLIPTNKVFSTLFVTIIGCIVVIYAGIKCRHIHASSKERVQQQLLKLASAVSSSSPKLEYSARFLAPLDAQKRTCILENQAQFNREAYDKLPELGIVLTVSSDRVTDNLLGTVHNLEVWAAKYSGYSFHFAVIETTDWKILPDGRKIFHFFTARWHHLQVFWKSYKWLLHLDGDMLVLRLDNNIDKWLAMDQEMMFHVSAHGDLAASAVLMRTMPISKCFLEHWIGMGDEEQTLRTANYDNGDMIQAVMDFTDPVASVECRKQFKRNNLKNFERCFFEKFHPMLETVHDWAPIRVLFPRQGFWRAFGRFMAVNARKRIGRSSVCSYPSDVLGHSWKQMATVWQPNRDNATIAFNSSIPAGCIDISAEDELAMMKRCCYYHFPGCVVDGVNVCYEQPHCKERNFTYILQQGC